MWCTAVLRYSEKVLVQFTAEKHHSELHGNVWIYRCDDLSKSGSVNNIYTNEFFLKPQR